MSVTAAQGFTAAGVAAGLKSSGDADVAVIVNQGPSAAAAAVFTSNRCKANPILWSEEAITSGSAKAVAINSGGANCYTGPDGFATTHRTAETVAERLGIGAVDVQVASTGLIGLLNDRDDVLRGVSAALDGLSAEGGEAAARAIMTTDSVPKLATRATSGYTVGGIAKGAGMLAPALATMLVFITTDAELAPEQLDAALNEAVRTTFNRIDSDGCQSTNDTVLLMASGASGASPDLAEFTEVLRDVCADLAHQLIVDAEGSEHEIAITVTNAVSEDEAVDAARSVARSNLFKAAIFGQDPNWGRVLASLGTTDATFDPQDLDVAMNDVWVCRGSMPDEDPAAVDLSDREVTVTIDLKSGEASATLWTNDLTHAYVHENSAYST